MKGMLKQSKKIFRIVLSFVLAFVLTIGIGIGVYAAYTHSLHAQRTIAPYELGIRFSSNYLLKGNSKDNIKTVYTTDISENGINPAAILTVCNYAQGKQTQPNGNAVTYTMTMKLVKESGNGFVDVVASDFPDYNTNEITYNISLRNGEVTKNFNKNNLSDSFASQVLPAKVATADVYELIFTKNFVSLSTGIFLEIIVTPTDSSLPTLTGIFKADVRVEGENNSWQGSFSDDQTNLSPSDYDGYNYVVTGFGTGTITLSWDHTKLEMNNLSIQEILAITGATYSEDNDISTLTFSVDSNEVNRYEIQFFKKNIDNNVTWNNLSRDIVSFEFR